MSEHGRRTALGVLVAIVAVLVPAGVLAATSVDRPPVSIDSRVGAAGLGLEGVTDTEAMPTTGVTTVAPAPPPPTSTVPVPPPSPAPSRTTPTTATTTPAATPAPGPATTPTLPPGVPLPAFPPPPSIPTVAPASSWSAEHEGITLRMRVEPAAPVAGQPVRFFVEVSTAHPCCALGLQFGDGADFSPIGNGGCAGPDPGAVVVPHTYANAGSHKVTLVATSFPCQPAPLGPDGQPMPVLHAAHISACVAVGPGRTQAGCSP